MTIIVFRSTKSAYKNTVLLYILLGQDVDLCWRCFHLNLAREI